MFKNFRRKGKNILFKHSQNSQLVSSRETVTSWGEGVFLASVSNPSSDGLTIKIPTLWGRCFITSTSLAPYLFLLGWLKRNLILIVRSVETDLGR